MKAVLAQRDGDFWADPRRRATAILGLLAVAAAVIVSLMVFFVGTSGGKHDPGALDVGPTTQATAHSPSLTHRASAARTTPTRLTSTSAPTTPAPTSTANPCPSAKPCAVAGDLGGAATALNKFRVSHGVPSVRVAAATRAQQCALGQGDGPSCQPHYAWQPVPTQNGAQVISKVAARDAGQWLLDRAATSFSVGWAYTPGPNGGPGQYGCAIIKGG